tara:strand:- start:236 stop:427 length:192 start_codon:yes stop_codon:yes gene_type:complete
MVANIPHHHEEVIAVSMGVPDLEEFEYVKVNGESRQTLKKSYITYQRTRFHFERSAEIGVAQS